MSRKAFIVTPEQRARVKMLAGLRLPEEDIARMVGCPVETLRMRFRRELALGAAEANAMVNGNLFTKARGGDLTTIIFWLKTRGLGHGRAQTCGGGGQGRQRALIVVLWRHHHRAAHPQHGRC